MGFLFVSLGAEDAIYPSDESTDPMQEVRAALLETSTPDTQSWARSASSWSVSSGRVDVSYEPAHMIGFESTSPPVVRIQLFRTLGWTVRLPHVDRALDRVCLWTHLDTGEETALVLES